MRLHKKINPSYVTSISLDEQSLKDLQKLGIGNLSRWVREQMREAAGKVGKAKHLRTKRQREMDFTYRNPPRYAGMCNPRDPRGICQICWGEEE